MKRVIKWLADVFNVELTREDIKEVEKSEYRYQPANGKITGDIVIEGDVRVEGNVKVYGGLSATGYISATGVYGSVTAKEDFKEVEALSKREQKFDGTMELVTEKSE